MSRRAGIVVVVVAAVAALLAVFLWRQAPAERKADEAPPEIVSPPRPATVHKSPLRTAVVRLAGIGDGVASGTVRLIDRGDRGGVAVDYRLDSLPPGSHVLALHEAADCASVDGTGAVELAGVTANVVGRARGKLVDEQWRLGEGPADALGRALVVRQGGLEGPALGCGVVSE